MKRARLEHGDCVPLMAAVAAESASLVILDPPHDISVGGVKWDRVENYMPWARTWLRESARVLRKGGALLLYGSPEKNWVSRMSIVLEDELRHREQKHAPPPKRTHPLLHSSCEKLRVTHDTVRSHPNAVCHIRRFKCQNPTRDSVVAQRTLSAEAIVLIVWSYIRASIATARFCVHPTEALVVVCTRPCWHGSNKNDGMNESLQTDADGAQTTGGEWHRAPSHAPPADRRTFSVTATVNSRESEAVAKVKLRPVPTLTPARASRRPWKPPGTGCCTRTAACA